MKPTCRVCGDVVEIPVFDRATVKLRDGSKVIVSYCQHICRAQIAERSNEAEFTSKFPPRP